MTFFVVVNANSMLRVVNDLCIVAPGEQGAAKSDEALIVAILDDDTAFGPYELSILKMSGH